MKKNISILFVTLFISLVSNGQNLFFIAETSLLCSNAITLESNSEDGANLELYFATKNEIGFVGVVTKTKYSTETFVEKLIIYLEDGTVITPTDFVESENVDSSAKALLYITPENVNKMKKSNIHTIRYTLNFMFSNTRYSASNKGNNTKSIATEFFEDDLVSTTEYQEEERKIAEINSRSQGAFANNGSGSGRTNSDWGEWQGTTFPGGNQGVLGGDSTATGYGDGGSGAGSQGSASGISFDLGGRSAISLPKPKYPGNDAGIVVVKIIVEGNGKVTSAEPGARGTTLANKKFWEEAKRAALKAKFNVDAKAPAFQQGTIAYRFFVD